MTDNNSAGELQVSTTNLANEPVVTKAKRARRARIITNRLVDNDEESEKRSTMANSENDLDVINDLIKLNNDRAAGFEKASADLDDHGHALIGVFNQLGNESRQYVAELTSFAHQTGDDEIAEGTSTSGDLHRAWIDIKSAFTDNDELAVLNECERGEDAAKAAYRDALDPEKGLSFELRQILQTQQQGIAEGHDLIKSLRDEAKLAEGAGDDATGEASVTGSATTYPTETNSFTAQPSYESDQIIPQTQLQFTPGPEGVLQEDAWVDDDETSTANSKLMEFFVNELKDLLWAERELIDTLPEMAGSATSAELKSAFELHLTETGTHVTRLEQIFGILGLEPESRKCEAMAGIVEEGQEIIDATEDGTAQRDVGLIFAAQKAEHYEIASYGGMVALAKTLGYYDIAETLVLTLDEEKAADAKLTEIAESQANYDASTERATDY